MKQTSKRTKITMLLRVLCLLLFILVIIYAVRNFIPDVVSLLQSGDEAAMEAYIHDAGKKGIVVMVSLQVLQTITIIFPGIPIYMCAGIIYGKVMGSVICYITYVVSNLGVFLAAKGVKKTADAITDNQKASKIEELLRKTGHPLPLVTLLCVIPVIPNGMIPHIAANAGLTFKQFSKAVAAGCIPGIVLFVCCGDLLMSEYFWLVIGIMIAAVVLFILSLVFKDKISAAADKLFARFTK